VKFERGRGERGAQEKKKKEISLGRWCDTRVPRFFGRGNTKVMSSNNSSKDADDTNNLDRDQPKEENALHRVVDNASSGISSLQSSSEGPDTTSEDAQGSSESSAYVDHSRDPRIEGHQIAPAHRRPNFLFAILSNESLSSAITWMPHGRSFKILNNASFSSQVLPVPVYYRHSNISSFLR
jgi:hypothetical protein